MKKFLLSCAVLFLAVGGAYAQSYIFVNSEKVFKSQNDYNTAIQQLDDLAKQYQKNVDDAYQTLEEAYSNYQAQKNYLSETKRAAKEQEIAAKRRAEEAEKERQRALRREQNPDGITDNVSKKKIRQQEKEAAEKAARAYEAKKNPVQESEEKKPLSGDPERPYSRGRAYDPAHYGRKRSAGSDAEQTEE